MWSEFVPDHLRTRFQWFSYNMFYTWVLFMWSSADHTYLEMLVNARTKGGLFIRHYMDINTPILNLKSHHNPEAKLFLKRVLPKLPIQKNLSS